MIDQAIVEEAAILTGIGIGTAFGLLVMLMVVVFVVRLSSGYLLERASRRATIRTAHEEAEFRNRAHAAVAAVTAIVAARTHADTAGGDQG